MNFPFASHFNALMHQVGLDEITGRSTMQLGFSDDSFSLDLTGTFDNFGIDIDLFQMFSALSTSQESPSGPEIDIDFDIGFHLIGFNFKIGTNQDSTDSDDQFYFSFSLSVECTMTGLPPLKAAMTLSDEEFSFGLEDLTIPLEIPKYPIDVNDLVVHVIMLRKIVDC